MGNETIVLERLKQANEYVSGESLSEEMNISRTAVWKYINKLRKKGYEIDSRTNMGYKLIKEPDKVTEKSMAALLPNRDRKLMLCFDTIDSTNTYLRAHAAEGILDGTVVVANAQTAGRGRRNRKFQSKADKGIYMSILWRPSLSPNEILPLTALGAVSICNAIERVAGIRPGIKWSNDLIINGKKLCGILTEMAIEGETGQIDHIVMGIGINVHQTEEDFEDEVKGIATSLSLACHRSISRAELAAAIVEELDQLRQDIGGDTSKYLQSYRNDCITLGKEVRLLWKDNAERVFALDVDEQFGLVVRHETGMEEVIRTGEVSVRGLYGYTPEGD